MKRFEAGKKYKFVDKKNSHPNFIANDVFECHQYLEGKIGDVITGQCLSWDCTLVDHEGEDIKKLTNGVLPPTVAIISELNDGTVVEVC